MPRPATLLRFKWSTRKRAWPKVAPCTRCRQLLCPSCDFAACDGCGNVFCSDYLMHEEDGSDPDLRSCRECTAVGAAPEQELPLLPAMVACGSEERTVHDGTFYLGLKRPLYSESGLPRLGVA